MAVVNVNLSCDLQKPVKVQYLNGNLFSQDNQANQIRVEVLDGGQPATLSGTVSANVIRADGGTVAVTGGTISGNVASITLPAAAYAVSGVASIIVKVTASGVITTIAAVVVNIYCSSTEVAIDPGTIIPSITTLIAAIDAAVASIPADYSSLWTSLAPAFSPDASYVAGQYVTNNGGVYRFNTTHSGAWAPGDVTAINIGGELTALKSALNVLDANTIFNSFNITTGKKINAAVGASADNLNNATTCIVTDYIPVSAGAIVSFAHLQQASSSTPTPSNPGVWYTDENHTVLRRDYLSNVFPYIYTGEAAPVGTAYIRLTLVVTYYPTNWEEYVYIKISESEKKVMSARSLKAFDRLISENKKDIRKLYLPNVLYWDKSEIRIPYESIFLSNNIKSVYFRRVVQTETLATTNNTMYDFYRRTLSGYSADTLAVYDSQTGEQIVSKVFAMNVVNTASLTNPESAKNIVIIGDSFVDNGYYVDYIADKLEDYGLTNINLIGLKQTSNGNKHEGHGGHGYYDYVHAPGTITRHVNPFWYNGDVDFAHYASECGVSTIDYIICHLGVNDLLNGFGDQIVTNMETFFNAAKADFPNIKIIFDGLVPATLLLETNYNPIYYNGKVFETNDAMNGVESDVANSYYAPVAATFDARYAYPYEMVAPYEGSTELVKHITDYLHPYAPGYYMIAKQALMCFLFNCIVN